MMTCFFQKILRTILATLTVFLAASLILVICLGSLKLVLEYVNMLGLGGVLNG